MTWPESVAYVCVVCKGHAISLVEKPWTEARECRSCYELPDLGRAPDQSTDASAGTPEAAPLTWGVDPEDGAASPTEGRGTSGGAEESGNPFFGGGTGDD